MNYLIYSISFFITIWVIKQLLISKFKIKGLIYPILFVTLIILIVLNPKNCIKAALDGVNIWFFTVLPSLLPFFILSEITIRLGVVKFIGSLMSPLMIPLFNVPGEGAFIFTMSITSGYPVGSKLISRLRLENKITKIEAQRLASFCSTSGPLFMIGAVSIGMFNNEIFGIIIALSHYLGALTVGLLFRFYKFGYNSNYPIHKYKNMVADSYNNLVSKKNIGSIMSDSVNDAMSTILVVGGFIIFYSVIIEILDSLNFIHIITNIINNLGISIDGNVIKGFVFGLIEITNGCKILSESINSGSLLVITLVSIIIGWSGLSIHSQSLSFFSKTDINNKIYIFSKMIHGLFSGIFTIILYHFINTKSVNVFSNTVLISARQLYFKGFINSFYISSRLIFFILLLLLVLSIGSKILYSIYKFVFKKDLS
ncbi:sporulation integral membrane protein YlbJ [Clostridium sp. D2Q-11]|uniref:Sporulation integral membrane protein YlbJ n=1 Tax=Anaeromonas frigoriresistens TaxID=2683708 RepID=A0A942Z9W9_9FIRM|nr:sporulation integral membrane protein YlbJ [Anaeromonas frigoriresistens]MBS4539753.1 sporulation integral membrane protein YlbJ [Anaeromonas frigoriresistens]